MSDHDDIDSDVEVIFCCIEMDFPGRPELVHNVDSETDGRNIVYDRNTSEMVGYVYENGIFTDTNGIQWDIKTGNEILDEPPEDRP